MSIASTRKVSSSVSYTSATRGAYESAQGRQSFVETIDTSNNVSINDERNSGGHGQGQSSDSRQDDTDFSTSVEAVADKEKNNALKTSSHVPPLLDNNEDSMPSLQNKSVGIYGANQGAYDQDGERPSNPYLKYFYENNETIEDIDEFV